jgi:uncharacterized protein DUF6600
VKRAVVLLVAALALAGCGSRAYAPASALAYGYDDADLFYNDLAPYGQWIEVRDYGRCWRPHGVGSDWQPYTEGHWEYTEYGWTWVSDEPWGWAPYHYGRWFYEPAYGWLWAPERQWAPAWVVWRRGGGHIGWAPAPPGWGPTWRRRAVEPRHYCFVEERRFAEPRVKHYVTRRNPGLVNSTREVTSYTVVDNNVHNRSIGVEDVEKVTGRLIPRHRVADFEQAAPRHVLNPQRWNRQEPAKQYESRGGAPPQVEERRDANFGRPPGESSIFRRPPDARDRRVEQRAIERREAERRNAEQQEAARRLEEERRSPARGFGVERRLPVQPTRERAPVIEQRQEPPRVEVPPSRVQAPAGVPAPAQSWRQRERPAENRQTGKPAVVSPEPLRAVPPINPLLRSRTSESGR